MKAHGEIFEQSQEEIIRDLQRQVSELTEANRLLQDQLARREQFIAMIAHDLRSPLAPIISYAQMLARHTCELPNKKDGAAPGAPVQAQTQRTAGTKNAQIQRQTSIIVSQARRMSRLVNDLLDVSRLSTGQFALVREECDIVALAREMVEQLRPVAPYHTLMVHAPKIEIKGNWDGIRLQQALGNLLDNAIKYSDEHTTISVNIRRTAGRVIVSVHNEGAGIPSTHISKLFHPYTRLTTLAGREGSGLGLYITKSIIDAHGGSLRLEPNNDDISDGGRHSGTTFTFELPLKMLEEAPAE
jgi:signal transduction histidine kinase